MKSVLFSLLLAVVFGLPNAAFAQAAATPAGPTSYNVYSYMSVSPGQRDNFLALTKAWKKIQVAKKKAGKIDDWSISRMLSPRGADSEYDYVIRTSIIGEENLAWYYETPWLMDGWQTGLTTAEISLVLHADDYRTMNKQEVWSIIDRTLADDIDKSTVAVFNYFSRPEGKTQADHIKVENDIWKPIHAARVKDGSLKGWILLRMEFPFGDAMPYDMATIDVYKDMKAYLAPFVGDYFKKIHSGKDMADLMKQTAAATTLVKGDVRMIIDRLDW